MSDPRTVFERLLAGIGEARWTELADLYAEDAVVDQPFMVPRRERLTGRAAIQAHFQAAARLPLTLRPHTVVVHTTNDPETIIAEFEYDVHNYATGRADTVANVQVLQIRDGLIMATRDYHDHLRLAATLDRASQLAATLG